MSEPIVSDSYPDQNRVPLFPPDETAVAYAFLRHVSFIFDELCAQGMLLWPDEYGRWQWRWQATELESAVGFCTLGEALVDAVIARYPRTFDPQVRGFR